jgi:general secretion pathway protein G
VATSSAERARILRVPRKRTAASRPRLQGVPRLAAFTLVELMLVIGMVAVLASIAIPSYTKYVDRGKVATAEGDIVRIEVAIAQYLSDNGTLPNALADLGNLNLTDPWGNPYQYLALAGIKGNGKARKDKSLVPINSDYDLYSMGKDGRSVPPLTAQPSRDDIVRGRNGDFVGLATDF